MEKYKVKLWCRKYTGSVDVDTKEETATLVEAKQLLSALAEDIIKNHLKYIDYESVSLSISYNGKDIERKYVLC